MNENIENEEVIDIEDTTPNRQVRDLIVTLKEEVKIWRIFSVIAVTLFIISIIINLIFNEAKETVIITPDGRAYKGDRKPLQVTEDVLQRFVDEAMVMTFSFQYRDLDDHFTDRLLYYYSRTGYKSLIEGLKASNFLDNAKNTHLSQVITPTTTVYKIRNYRDEDGNYGYIVFRSYAIEAVTDMKRDTYELVYEVKVKEIRNSSRYYYDLMVEGVKEYSLTEYRERFGFTQKNK